MQHGQIAGLTADHLHEVRRTNDLLQQLVEKQVVVPMSDVRPIIGQDKKRLVIDHLELHPEDMTLPVRQLAEKLNVGRDTVSRAKKELGL